jgi:hypothetical protein
MKKKCLDKPCDTPCVEGKSRCAAHLARNIGYRKKMTDRWIETGKCSECGKFEPLDAFSKNERFRPCESCYFKKCSKNAFGTRKYAAFIKAKLDAQGWKCAYTGEVLVLGVNDSLDHIFPAFHFPELKNDPCNTEWVTRKVNEMKRDRTPDEFLALIESILHYRLRSSTGSDVGASVLREAVCFS